MRWILVVGLACSGLAPDAVRADERPSGSGTSGEALAILADVLPAGSYADKHTCVSTRSVRRVDVLDDGHVLFSTRREAWLNRLALTCRGLRPGQMLQFSQYGSRLCHHDTLLARERGVAAGEDFPPRCRLGPFEKIDLQQAAMLREQFRQLRLSRRHPAQPSTPVEGAQSTAESPKAEAEAKADAEAGGE